MVILNSSTEERKKYFFEGFGFETKTIEQGHANPDAKGKVIGKLEISLESNEYFNDPDLRAILKDCCPIEIIEAQGIGASLHYIESCSPNGKMYKPDNKIYVHTILEE